MRSLDEAEQELAATRAYFDAKRKREADGKHQASSVQDGPMAAVLRRVQADVRCYIPEGIDLAAELIEDRRREAADESSG